MFRYIRPTRFITTRAFTTTRPRYSLLDTAKEKLNELNQKVGKAAASTIESTENAAEVLKEKADHATEQVKETGSKVAGTAEEVKNAYDAKGTKGVEEKAKEHLGRETVEEGKEAARDLKNRAEDLAQDAKRKAQDVAQDAKHHGKKLSSESQKLADEAKVKVEEAKKHPSDQLNDAYGV